MKFAEVPNQFLLPGGAILLGGILLPMGLFFASVSFFPLWTFQHGFASLITIDGLAYTSHLLGTSFPTWGLYSSIFLAVAIVSIGFSALRLSKVRGRWLRPLLGSVLMIFLAGLLVASPLFIQPVAASASATQTAIGGQFQQEKTCGLIVFTDGTNYYGQNCDTGVLSYGGAGNAGGATGTTFSTVANDVFSDSRCSNGCTVYFLQGTYTVGTTLTVGKGVFLVGETWNTGAAVSANPSMGVIFNGAVAAGTDVVDFTAADGGMSTIFVNGEKSNNTPVSGQNCVALTNTASQVTLTSISVVNCAYAGIYDAAPAGEDWIINPDVKTSNFAGYYCNGCFDEHLIGGVYGSNVGPCIKLNTASDITMTGYHCFLSSSDYGVIISNSGDTETTACTSHDNNKGGLEIFKSVSSSLDGDYNSVTNCTFNNNSQAGAGLYPGILVAGSVGDIAQYNTITGNSIYDSQVTKTQVYGIEETPNANSNFLAGNSLGPEQTSGLYTTSANSVISPNAGTGNGVYPCSTQQKSETGADTSILSCKPVAIGRSYTICISLVVTAANTATLGWTATWTDGGGNAQTPTNLALTQDGTAAPALTFTTSAAGDYNACQEIDVNNALTAVVIKTTFSGTSIAYTASASMAPTY